MSNDCLAHFNPNHDPNTGRFTKNLSGSKHKRKTIKKSEIDWGKAALIGGVAVAGTLAVIGGYSLYKSGVLNDYVADGMNFIKKIPKDMIAKDMLNNTSIDHEKLGKSAKEIDKQMVRNINGLGPITAKRQINCTHCTTAYILNSLFGMNVRAKGFDGYDPIYHTKGMGRPLNIIVDAFDNLKIDSYNKLDKTDRGVKRWNRTLNSLNNGSTGILHVTSILGTSHVINYEKTTDGVVTLIDPQSKKIISGELRNKIFQMSGLWNIETSFDFSNAKINPDAFNILNTMVDLRKGGM